MTSMTAWAVWRQRRLDSGFAGHLRNAEQRHHRGAGADDRLKELQRRRRRDGLARNETGEVLGSFLQTTAEGVATDYESNLRITGAVRGQPKWTEVELSWENSTWSWKRG